MSHPKLLTAIAAGLLAAVAAAPTPAISAAGAPTDTDAAIELPAGFAAIWQDSQFDWDLSATAQDGLQLINGFTATGEYARISVYCSHEQLSAGTRAMLERGDMVPGPDASKFRIEHQLARPMPYHGDASQLQHVAASLLRNCD